MHKLVMIQPLRDLFNLLYPLALIPFMQFKYLFSSLCDFCFAFSYDLLRGVIMDSLLVICGVNLPICSLFYSVSDSSEGLNDWNTT